MDELLDELFELTLPYEDDEVGFIADDRFFRFDPLLDNRFCRFTKLFEP